MRVMNFEMHHYDFLKTFYKETSTFISLILFLHK